MSFASIDDLIDFLAGLAHVPSVEAEGFSELDHGLQCAAELAEAAPGDVELQVAGLVHDVAHTLGFAPGSAPATGGSRAISAPVPGSSPTGRFMITTAAPATSSGACSSAAPMRASR